jgi:DIM1 family U5 snRNP protein
MKQDECLFHIADKIKNFAVMCVSENPIAPATAPPPPEVAMLSDPAACLDPRSYLVDISEVPDFNTMYELYDPSTIMFFFRNKHIMIDLGTGNNNKINWPLQDKQEFIDIVEVVYRGARKGRGLVVSPKDYSTKYKY